MQTMRTGSTGLPVAAMADIGLDSDSRNGRATTTQEGTTTKLSWGYIHISGSLGEHSLVSELDQAEI
jgi:hypothetical protein